MKNKFVYSCSINICALEFDELLESIFCLLLVVAALSLQKVAEILEVVVGLARWQMNSQSSSTSEALVVLHAVGCVSEKNWALPVDQRWLQTLQFWVHLINLLSILLWCNGFARIQRTVEDQMGSRPLNSDRDLFLVQVWLWEVLGSFFSLQPLSWSLLAVV